jgi:hypothetical protein
METNEAIVAEFVKEAAKLCEDEYGTEFSEL